MSADPVIQAPDDLQSFNRYSYVMNSPFMYTDPTGFKWTSGARWWNAHYGSQTNFSISYSSSGNFDGASTAQPASGASCTAATSNSAAYFGDQNANFRANTFCYECYSSSSSAPTSSSIAFSSEGKNNVGVGEQVGKYLKGEWQQAKNNLAYDVDHPGESFQKLTEQFGAGGMIVGTVGKSGRMASLFAKLFRTEDAVVEAIKIAPGKFDYLFGRVASSPHNAARSNQLALEMKRLGVPDTAAGHAMLTEHFAQSARTNGNVLRTYTDEFGKFEVLESLFIGPSGGSALFQTTFELLENGIKNFSTVVPLNNLPLR